MPLRHRIAIVSLVALLATDAASAQRMLGPNPNAPNMGVYVRDSAVAGEKLALAERMERLKEWDKSADVYQEIVEKYADRVVPIAPGGALMPPAEPAPAQPPPADNPPAAGDRARDVAAAANMPLPRYKSVTLAVQERLGKWPEEGLAMYRARYEAQAVALRDQAGLDDAAALSRVMQLYFPTDAAKLAAMRLIELYIETGEFAAAAWTGERVLAHHPSLGDDRGKLLFRTALAEHLAGDATNAQAKLGELKSKFAGAQGRFRGQDVALAGELEKILASSAAVANGAATDSWPIFGGDATRGRIPVAGARPGAKLVEIPFLRPRQRPGANPPPDAAAAREALNRKLRDNGAGIGVVPVVDRGEIFYQDNTRVYAKGMESGFTLPGWSTTYGDDSAGLARPKYGVANLVHPSNTQLTVTVTDSAVLAVLGQASRMVVMNEMGITMPAESDGQLTCLDRQTGVRRWSSAPRNFPDSLANLRALELGGSPLVVGDNVYVAARGGKPMQFEDSYVLCFNLADGKVRWACYLASGNANPQQPSPAGDVSHLAYAGGRVYAVTNLGAVASIDAYAGTIAWLSLYPRPVQNNNPNFGGMNFPGQLAGANRRPWAQNPTIVRDGRVFCLPSDSQHLIVYDAASGDEHQRIAMSDFDNADTIVGVAGDRVVLTSANEVFCVHWPKYDAKDANASLAWKGPLPGPEGTTEDENRDTVRGRAFLTTDSVFIPTRWNLRRLSLKSGRAEQTYPPNGSWAAGEGPGNVLVTGDQILIAGADSICVYSDLALARAKLDRAIEAAPNDPLPRLMYAETLFAAGQIDPAIDKLDAAIQLLGGLRSMRPGIERDRAFARSLAFAERLANPKEGASDLAKAASLFDRAAAAASTPPQQVAYRLSRARFARERQRDFNLEVRLYQDILANPAWRAVVVPSEDGASTTTAASLAEASIGERVKDMPSAYAAFERAAGEQLAIAKQAKEPAQMLAVAQVYPNAKVAADAMLAAADAYEAAGQFRPATQVLNRAYLKYHDEVDKLRIIEAQARNYLKLPGSIGIAIGRLNEANKLQAGAPLKQPLVLPDNQRIEGVTFAAAAELVQKYSARLAAASLPDFNIPPWKQGKRRKAFLPETPESIIADVDQLLVPPRGLREAGSRNDRIVTWTRNAGVSVYALGSNTPLGTNSTLARQPLGIAWCSSGDKGGKDLLVWTADRIALLKGDGLGTGWDVTVKGLPQVDIIDAADAVSRVDEVRFPGVLVQPGQVFVDGQLVNVGVGGLQRPRNLAQLARAQAQQQQPQQQAERIEHVRPLGDRVVFATSAGRITALDLANGQLVWQTRTGDAPLEQLVASDDFLAARFTDSGGPQLVALETFGGQVVMRTSFTPETAPSNVALAPDGTLLYTRPDRICGKDLYEPGAALKFGGEAVGAEGGRVFDRNGAPGGDDAEAAAEQIVVAEGRIYAVADQGQFVRVLSLSEGKEVANRLGTGSNDWNVRMRVVGPRLYVFNSQTVTSYHVVRDDESWKGLVDTFQAPSVVDQFIGKQHVVLLDQPTAPGAEPSGETSARFRLLAYGRYPTAQGRDDESGKFDQSVDVQHPVGIHVRQWQPVEGGFYYHSVDRKVHFLKGSGTEAANPKS